MQRIVLCLFQVATYMDFDVSFDTIFLVTIHFPLSGSLDNGNKGENVEWWSDPDSKVHIGVGCDFCGVKSQVLHILQFC